MIKNLEIQQSLISSAQVEDYLWQHPDFFNDHLDLLGHITVPHPCGSAVSLVSKQLEIYRTRHRHMENQLSALIDIARENDTLFSRMHELTLAMLDSATLEETLANLEQVLFECFLADFVAVKIFQENNESPINNLFVSAHNKALQNFHQILADGTPKCSRPTLAQARFLFGNAANEVQSCAFIPLFFSKLDGLLVIGSRQRGRYHRSLGNLFLTQIGEIVGARLISLLQDHTP